MSQTIWEYNGMELEFDLSDVEVIEKYEKVFDEAQQLENDIPKTGATSVITKAHCGLFKFIFDELFGEGTTDALVDGKTNNLNRLVDAYADFLRFVDKQQTENSTRYMTVKNRYADENRKRRREYEYAVRNNQSKNPHNKKRRKTYD